MLLALIYIQKYLHSKVSKFQTALAKEISMHEWINYTVSYLY